MSLLKNINNNDIYYRNNQTLQSNYLSEINHKNYLPKILPHKKSHLNTLNNTNNIILKKIKIKSPNLKHSIKYPLFSPKRASNNINPLQPKKYNFISKVIIENAPSSSEIKYFLENYLKKSQTEIKFKYAYENGIMIFSFDDEKIALDFATNIFKEKTRNPLYLNTKINITLSEKEKIKKLKDKEKKIAKEILRRLFYGEGYEKKEKPIKKILGNIKFGIESPFFNANQKRIKKNFSGMMLEEKNLFKKKFNENKEGKFKYIEYDDQSMRNYQKLKINNLDTSYKPPSEFKLREEDKTKWMSPLDFKIY